MPDRQCRASSTYLNMVQPHNQSTHAHSSLDRLLGSMRTSSSCKLVQPADAIDGIILYGLGLQAGVVQGLQLATEQLRRANYHLMQTCLHYCLSSLYFSEEGGAALGWISM